MRSVLPPELSARPLRAVRNACAWVAARARRVGIDHARLVHYAAEVPIDEALRADPGGLPAQPRTEAALAAFVLTLDAINFGSGWFPQFRKRPGLSGYRTLEACLRDRFECEGHLTASELRELDACACAELFEQDPTDAALADLMELLARALRELGEWIDGRFRGDFCAPVQAAGESAEALVRLLLEMPLYRDVADYEGRTVPFLKRAQLTASDLARALPDGLGRFRDLDELTLFADNLVPHVLRTDGVLVYDPELVAAIEREELLPHGSLEEVEIRACAVQAVELLVRELRKRGVPACPAALDHWLWLRGAAPAYKARPRHRTRTPYY